MADGLDVVVVFEQFDEPQAPLAGLGVEGDGAVGQLRDLGRLDARAGFRAAGRPRAG